MDLTVWLNAHLSLVEFVTWIAPQTDWFRFAWILGKDLSLSVWTWRGLGSRVIWVILGSGSLSAGFGFMPARVIRWRAIGRCTSTITWMAVITCHTCTRRSIACSIIASTALRMVRI